jgi:hypothetical protein
MPNDDMEKEFLGAIQGLEMQMLRQRQQELSQKPFSELTAEERIEYQGLIQRLR